MAQILVVDDEATLRHYVKRVLKSQGHGVTEAGDGAQALDLARQHTLDLIILDLMMPEMDGLTVCREIRRFSMCPIIVLSGLADETNKVAAFDEGADDYLTKPFGPAELTARVRAVLRRTAGPGPRLVEVQDLVIDLDGNTVTRDGTSLRLTRTELALIRALAQNGGKTVSHRALLQAVWGPQYAAESSYLHVYMGRLRRKLEEDPSEPRYIGTDPGVGYRLLI